MNNAIRQKIIYVSEDRWVTYGFFNGNAYPQHIRTICEASSERAAIFRFQVKNINDIIKKDRQAFFKHLLTNKEDLMKGLKEKPELNLLIYYDGLEYLTYLHAIFNSLKSFLDVYAQLIGKLISPTQKLSFKRGIVEGNKLSGGRLINWLRASAQNDYKENKNLSEIILRNSKTWISEVVSYRDQLNHYGDIAGLNHMHVDPKDLSKYFKEEYIENPVMPDGTEVVLYCVGLLNKLGDFIAESLKLLPNIDLKLIRRGGFSSI